MSPDLIRQIQDHTGFPWWNGEAYAGFMGYPQQIWKLKCEFRRAIDDLSDVVELLRNEKHFAEADRLRAIAARMSQFKG